MSFAETMLLLDSVVRSLPFAESAVLMPCNRGVLLAADSRSSESIGAMLREAERCLLEEPWPMSSLMCRRNGNGWVEFEPPPEHANLAHGLAIRHLAENYSVQKELEALHVARGVDIYVADYTLIRTGEKWQSYCVWAEGVDTLLPLTDWVAILPEGEASNPIRVPWDRVAEICADRIAATSESPPRFEVRSFPGDRQWALLLAHAIGD
jgi:hypothetical protein